MLWEQNKWGGESLHLHLEALETVLCNIKRNADELLYLFRCLKVAKWEAEHKEDEENGENWRC